MNYDIVIKTFLFGFIFALGLGPIIIPMLKRLKAGQSIRQEGPKSHYKKSGTPAMGAFIFLVSLLLCILLFRLFTVNVAIVLLSTFGFGMIGFLDDYIKIVLKRNLGLKAKQKILGQFIMAIILSTILYFMSTEIYIPIYGGLVDLGYLYIPVCIFIAIATTNSVNLTDGLDGLSSGVTLIVLLFFAHVSYKLGDSDISMLCIILAGALLGFLMFNKNPAKVFMGDTGSIALGGFITAVFMLTKMHLLIPVFGFIYFVETLSVTMQVLYYKRTKKRIFKMAPIHHHFELSGWSEVKVVRVFYIVTVAACVLGIIII